MRAARLAAAGLLAALALQCVLSMRLLGATFDEHAHLPAGYTYWKTGDLRLNPQHPPLVKLLAGLPLLLLKPTVRWDDESWAGPRPSQWRFGSRFLYLWGNDADLLLFWGRLPTVLLSLLLGVYVFRWSAERFGPRAGIAGLLLYAFCPNILAHSRFVTMDLALATFSTMALYYLWRFRRDGTRRPLILCGLSLGLALAAKFSAVVIAVVVMGALVLRSRAVPAASSKKKKRTAVAPDAVGWAAAVGIAAGLAVLIPWISYLFPADPAFYWKGIAVVNRDHNPNHFYYLLGDFKQGGWWYYFLAAFIFKTPVPAQIAIVAAGVAAWRSRSTTGRDDLLLLVPAAAFFAFTSALADNLGIRYLLPVYPLLFVFASRVGEVFTRGRARLAAVALLSLWQIAGTVRVYPDYLAYFNEPSGGPANGYRLMDDSNIDWGQDLKRLGAYLNEQKPAGPVRVCYDLNGHPPYYGLEGERLPLQKLTETPAPGFYAIAVHCLVRVQMLDRPGQPSFDWRRRYEPVGRVGYSFYLFQF